MMFLVFNSPTFIMPVNREKSGVSEGRNVAIAKCFEKY